MTSAGAAGLSVAAIETMLAHGARDWHRPADLAAARAELAALVEAAGRVGPLAAALADLLNGGRWSDGYGARKFAMRLTGDEHAALHDLLAEAGPGPAGARDEAPPRVQALEAVALAARTFCEGRRAGDRAYAGVLLPTEVALVAALARLDLLDALRAGGAGEGGEDDG